MSTPARRPSPAVYRRRRLVFFTGVLVVLALIVWGVWALVAGLSRNAGTPASTPSVSASSPTPAPTPTATDAADGGGAADAGGATDAADAGPAECTAGDVTVEAVTDQGSYAADQTPQLSIRLTNTSGADCTMNVGTSAQSFVVTSGTDTWWRSTDCQSEPSDMVVTIAAGQTVQSATPIAWDRTRSSVDSCQDPNREKAPGGGASYHLAVTIGGIAGTGSAQFILN